MAIIVSLGPFQLVGLNTYTASTIHSDAGIIRRDFERPLTEKRLNPLISLILISVLSGLPITLVMHRGYFEEFDELFKILI